MRRLVASRDGTSTTDLVASLGITFPFNVLLGIPLYRKLAGWLGA